MPYLDINNYYVGSSSTAELIYQQQQIVNTNIQFKKNEVDDNLLANCVDFFPI